MCDHSLASVNWPLGSFNPTMKLVILISASLALLATLHGATAEKARFDNYRIYSVKIDTTEQLMQLQDLDRHLDGVSIALEEQLFAISCSCVLSQSAMPLSDQPSRD